MVRQHTVHIQAKAGRGSRKLIKLLRENGFHAYLVDTATGEYESLENGATVIKARSAAAGKTSFIDCLYNSNSKFPPQEVMRAAALHPSVTYIGMSRGDITSVT